MIKLKNIISFCLSLCVIVAIVLNIDIIADRLNDISGVDPHIVVYPSNGFDKGNEYIFVSQVDEYVPNNYKDLVNIFYSILNQGWEEFTFYCPDTYTSCLDDVEKISYDEVLLSEINNFVHPYNSYSTIKTLYDDNGKITIKIKHLYSTDEIEKIDKKINDIIDSNLISTMNDEEKIRTLHDYVINNTKYDQKRADYDSSPYDSTRILGILDDGYAVCSGYTDIMAVMLTKIGIDNFKIASDTHIWNAVYINDEWKHLDLTWDDPITSSGKDILDYSYFLIDTRTLMNLDKKINNHNFDRNVYLEFNE